MSLFSVWFVSERNSSSVTSFRCLLIFLTLHETVHSCATIPVSHSLPTCPHQLPSPRWTGLRSRLRWPSITSLVSFPSRKSGDHTNQTLPLSGLRPRVFTSLHFDLSPRSRSRTFRSERLPPSHNPMGNLRSVLTSVPSILESTVWGGRDGSCALGHVS